MKTILRLGFFMAIVSISQTVNAQIITCKTVEQQTVLSVAKQNDFSKACLDRHICPYVGFLIEGRGADSFKGHSLGFSFSGNEIILEGTIEGFFQGILEEVTVYKDKIIIGNRETAVSCEGY